MREEPTVTSAEATEPAIGAKLEELYLRFGPGGLRLAYLLTGDPQAAEDCVQEAFARIVGRLGHVRGGMTFDAYLRTTIVNLVKNGWRRRSVERAKALASAPADQMPASDAAVVEHVTVWHAILQLPVQQRTAIVLRFYEDLAEDDIATIMRCRPGTARSLVSRGMASLRLELGRSDDG